MVMEIPEDENAREKYGIFKDEEGKFFVDWEKRTTGGPQPPQ